MKLICAAAGGYMSDAISFFKGKIHDVVARPLSKFLDERGWLAEEKATLHELAAKYNVSAERIRQLEKNAMSKLKGRLLA